MRHEPLCEMLPPLAAQCHNFYLKQSAANAGGTKLSDHEDLHIQRQCGAMTGTRSNSSHNMRPTHTTTSVDEVVLALPRKRPAPQERHRNACTHHTNYFIQYKHMHGELHIVFQDDDQINGCLLCLSVSVSMSLDCIFMLATILPRGLRLSKRSSKRIGIVVVCVSTTTETLGTLD